MVCESKDNLGSKSSLEELKNVFDDIDFDLMIFNEYCAFIECGLACNELMARRAVELGFNPEFLTDEMELAAFCCMDQKELEPFSKALEIAYKNRRLRKNLTPFDKKIVRFHVRNTIVFGKLDEIQSEKAKQEILKSVNNEILGACAYLYQDVMERYNEKMFEKPFAFLPKERFDPALMGGFRFLVKMGLIENWCVGEDGEIKSVRDVKS